MMHAPVTSTSGVAHRVDRLRAAKVSGRERLSGEITDYLDHGEVGCVGQKFADAFAVNVLIRVHADNKLVSIRPPFPQLPCKTWSAGSTNHGGR